MPERFSIIEAIAMRHSSEYWDGTYRHSLQENFSNVLDETEINDMVEHHRKGRLESAYEWSAAILSIIHPSTLDDLGFIAAVAPAGTVIEDIQGDLWEFSDTTFENITGTDSNKAVKDMLPGRVLKWGEASVSDIGSED